MKAIDRNIDKQALERGFKDKEFEQKEKQSFEQLTEALNFVRE